MGRILVEIKNGQFFTIEFLFISKLLRDSSIKNIPSQLIQRGLLSVFTNGNAKCFLKYSQTFTFYYETFYRELLFLTYITLDCVDKVKQRCLSRIQLHFPQSIQNSMDDDCK